MLECFYGSWDVSGPDNWISCRHVKHESHTWQALAKYWVGQASEVEGEVRM